MWRTVFETEWFSVEQGVFPGVHGLQGKPYYRIESPDGVLILPLTERGELILVWQFRPALGRHTLEFPSGSCGRSESPDEAASRELYEETGYRCAALQPLVAGRITVNRRNTVEHAFFAPGAVQDPNFRPKEDIEVVLVSSQEFRALVCSGRFEELAALGLLVLAEWRLGVKLGKLA